MSINFSRDRMEEVKENHQKFLDGTLNRPLIQVTHKVREAENTKTEILSQANCHDFSVSAEEVIERYDMELATLEFSADAYPRFTLDTFGPGVAAAFCGAKLDNSSGAVWFYPPDEKKPLEELHIKYDPENPWALRCKELLRAGAEKWQGSVALGFPDLGGVMDVLASFRSSEELLFDLIDNPDEVKRLVKEEQTAWREAYEDMASAMGGFGYTDWNGVLSREKCYVLQNDFGYMIGPDMFNEFALPGIKDTAKKLGKATYHLDGIGCLPDLPEILKIPEIRMVQWVPGDGNPLGLHWIDTYKKIREAGKGAHILGNFSDFEDVASALKSAEGLYFCTGDINVTAETLKKYGIK